ncbi:hypothetical protein GCM10011507_33370 [Edaphobacter acidisoli]|uniref:Tyr recombinase domain-containing protein n=1 Tax=Edaphobacter acidisoli TaxID=2040573 RepID=A0A916S0U8_9BACT|nr:tyrosine-type recombinase/integrase [Edaphobacter acidisoli]GGA79449.1 hypothetical protein GCM10011507_33370 [Edaphobacter acidisoli]
MQLSFFEDEEKGVSWARVHTKEGHTPGHVMCTACARLHMGSALLSPALAFEEAFEIWIARRILRHRTLLSDAHYISERTEWDYRQYARALAKFFTGMPLASIRKEHLYAYQHDRAFCEDGRWERQAGANRIRKEVGMLLRMLREAGVWQEGDGKPGRRYRGDDDFQLVSAVESDIQRALTPEEQYRWLEVAGSKNRWQFIYQYSIVALQTCMSTNELRGLRIDDVRLDQRVVQVRWACAKNRFRVRTIPLETEEVCWAFESLIYRAQKLGAAAPHHYLFPLRERQHSAGVTQYENRYYDPTRPMTVSGLRKLWDEVRDETGLNWFVPYDTRHSGLTRLAEAGIPIGIIRSYSGHMTRKMEQHYTQISMMSKRKAAASTWSGSVPRPALVSVESRDLRAG